MNNINVKFKYGLNIVVLDLFGLVLLILVNIVFLKINLVNLIRMCWNVRPIYVATAEPGTIFKSILLAILGFAVGDLLA